MIRCDCLCPEEVIKIEISKHFLIGIIAFSCPSDYLLWLWVLPLEFRAQENFPEMSLEMLQRVEQTEMKQVEALLVDKE